MSTFSWDEQNRRSVVEGREVVERLPTSLAKNNQLNTKCHSSNNNHHYSKMHHATAKTETALKLFGLKGKPWSAFGDIAGDLSSSSSSSSDDAEDHEKNTSQKSSALSSENSTVPNSSSSHLHNNGPRTQFVGRTGKRSANKIMRLNRQDMSLYGLCPQTDPFFVVICGTCRKVLRPQGLQRHIEIRHKGKQQDVNNDVASHLSEYHQLLEPPTQPIPRKPQPPVAVCNGTTSSSNGMLMEVTARDHTHQQQREPKGASSDGKDGSKRSSKVQFTRPTTHNTTSSTNTNTNTRNTFENFTNTDTSSQFTTISTSSATSKSWGTGGSGSSISSSSSSSSSTTSTSLDSFNSSSSTSNSPLSLTNELYDGIAAIERKRVETKENGSRRARKQSLPKTPQTDPAIASKINTPNQSSRYSSHHSSTSNSRSQKRKIISKEPVDTEEPQRKAQKRLPELKMPKLSPPLLEMLHPYYNQNGNDPDLHQQAPPPAPSRISLPLDVILPMNIDLINMDTTVAGTQLEITGTNQQQQQQQQQSVTINHMGMPELTLLRDNNSPPPLLALVPQNHTNINTLYTGTNEHYMNENRINLLMMSPPPPPPPVPMNGTIYDCFDPAGTIYDQILLTELENGDENVVLSSDDDDDDGKSIDFKELKVLRNMDKEETPSLRTSTLTPATPKPVAYNNFNMRGIGGGGYVMATQRKFIELKKSLKNDDNYSNSTKTLPKTWSFIERHHLLLPVVRLTQ